MREKPTQAESFQRAYQGQPPWDVGHAQQALVEVAPRIEGSVLDVGCGTGDNAIFFAGRGHSVYGVDVVEEAISRAKEKAAAAKINACFLVLDALALGQLPMLFDNVIDCGLFHVFSDEDRLKYVKSLANILRPGGLLWLQCFSDSEPSGNGPRRVSQAELKQSFHTGWDILSIEPTRFETSPHVLPGEYSDGGPHGYLAVIRREA